MLKEVVAPYVLGMHGGTLASRPAPICPGSKTLYDYLLKQKKSHVLDSRSVLLAAACLRFRSFAIQVGCCVGYDERCRLLPQPPR